MLLRKRDRSSSRQSYASTTTTTTSALTNLHHAQTFHHSGQSHHLADYSPSSKSSPVRRERSLSRSPEGSTKTWRREGTTRVPRLVSNESIEHERSSSEEFEEFERAEPELRGQWIIDLYNGNESLLQIFIKDMFSKRIKKGYFKIDTYVPEF